MQQPRPQLQQFKRAAKRLCSQSGRLADKLVYSHETIHLQNKLQDAGWEAEGVAHESDSDSDDEAASDEEKDLAEEIFSEETVLLLMQ